MTKQKVILMILDGWGIGNKDVADIIHLANTPFMDSLKANFPNATLKTSGEDVGLPDGQMGNSEVGHLNIGAGRVVYQDLMKINKAVETNSISKNPVLTEAFQYAKQNNKAVHFLGLISDGGVHSLDTHLYKLCDITKDYGIENVYIHALTDGRDTDPRSGLGFMKNLVNHLKTSNGKIASVVGRYYTMDRDKRWERVKIGYDTMVYGVGEKTTDVLEAMQNSYNNGITDEFIKPIVAVDENGQPIGNVKEGDVFFCFNYRTDRLRQITTAFTQKDFPEQNMKQIPLHYLTMTNYDKNFKGINIVYDKDDVKNTLGELVAKTGKTQLRIAETEKFAHVTFFFSGGREEVFVNEERILVNSPKVATYDLQPEMSAPEVTQKVVEAINTQKFDFICLNFANPDMIGHTGIREAIFKAIETVDNCVEKVITAAQSNGYEAIIIADHGNADYAQNPDGSENTAHSLNPVPCIVVSNRFKNVKDGILADVAPTILKMLDMEIPDEMTGNVLIS